MSRQTIFAFVGHMGSGKGSAVEYLKEAHGASSYRFSSIIRDVMRRLYIGEERENLIVMSQILRDRFGETLFAKAMAADIAKDTNTLIAIDGVRRVADLEGLRNLPDFVLVHIFTDDETRLKRMNTRGENPDDASRTMADMLRQRQMETEKTIDDVIPLATEIINNNGTVEELHVALDALVKKYASSH